MSAILSSVSDSASVHMAANAASMQPLFSLVYQSRAVAPLSDSDLAGLLTSAQARNRKEGVTGLLVYDQGRFVQWLEGPTEGLGRVWSSIRHDTRHTAVSMLGGSSTPARFFGGSALALGMRGGEVGVGTVGGVGSTGQSANDGLPSSGFTLPAELVETLYRSPESAPSLLAALAPQPAQAPSRALKQVLPGRLQGADHRAPLQALVERVIVPTLLARHAAPLVNAQLASQMARTVASTVAAKIAAEVAQQAADPRAAELAQLLLAANPRAAFALIDTLRADGRSITQLCAGLFEPAARALGDLWHSDDCSEFDVTLGLGHLQIALRRASVDTSSADNPRLPASMPHAVLVATPPRESHILGSVIAAEVFWRAGWDVSCEFPDSDAALGQLVHDRWFDVLDLSLSGAFTRDHRMAEMAASIRSVHAHSRNPALTVIVDGRVFHEHPQQGAEVGADASSTSSAGLVSAALRHSRQSRLVPQAEGS